MTSLKSFQVVFSHHIHFRRNVLCACVIQREQKETKAKMGILASALIGTMLIFAVVGSFSFGATILYYSCTTKKQKSGIKWSILPHLVLTLLHFYSVVEDKVNLSGSYWLLYLIFTLPHFLSCDWRWGELKWSIFPRLYSFHPIFILSVLGNDWSIMATYIPFFEHHSQ